METNKDEWASAEALSNLPLVNEVLQGFAGDPTSDNGVMVVREVMRALAKQADAAPVGMLSAQDVCDLLRGKSLLSDRGLSLALNGDAVSLDIGSITAIVNAALAQRVVSSSPSAPCEAVPVADGWQDFFDSLDAEDKMFAQIDKWARESYLRHKYSCRGQQITAADSENAHVIWAALRWAKESTPPAAPVALSDAAIDEISASWHLYGRNEQVTLRAYARDIERRLAAATQPTDADKREDTELLNWFDSQVEACGTEGYHEGNRWAIDGPFHDLRHALRECKAYAEQTAIAASAKEAK